jgi:preprotein translocase subunit YajC
MDTFSSIAGIVLLSVAVIPVVYLQISQQKKAKKRIERLAKLAKANQQILTQTDVFPLGLIGSNESPASKATHLFYLREGKNPTEVTIRLDEISQVELKTIYQENDINLPVELVEIHLQTPQKIYQISFFDQQETVRMNGEISIAKKWLNKIELSI